MVHGGHENQVAPRQGNVRGDARPFVSNGLLGHLYQDFLPLLQAVFNGNVDQVLLQIAHVVEFLFGRLGRLFRRLTLTAPFTGIEEELFDFPHGVMNVADIQERRLFQVDVHKSGLHPRKHAHHSALVNVAAYTEVRAPLNIKFRDLPVFHEGHTGFKEITIDDELCRHLLFPPLPPGGIPLSYRSGIQRNAPMAPPKDAAKSW